jgi:hypothetical protein
MVVLRARVQRKNLLLARLPNAQSMANGAIGKNGASAPRNVALASITARARSRFSPSLVANQSKEQRRKKKAVRRSLVLWHAKYLISRTLVSAQSAVEVAR